MTNLSWARVPWFLESTVLIPPALSLQGRGQCNASNVFKFDRNAITIREVWAECQRYEEAKKARGLVGFTKLSRSEQRYINERQVVLHDVHSIMESKRIAVEKAIQDLSTEHAKSKESIARFLKTLRKRQLGRKTSRKGVPSFHKSTV